MGAPISVDQVDEPTKEQIDSLHAKYCDALNELFETHKLKYGNSEDDHLEMA